MRIVAGRHGGRRLKPVPPGIRPTADRAKEALFSMLASGRLGAGPSPIQDAIVLDAFAGTGALGLEALSRGASRVIFLDADRRSLDLARENAALLNETDRCLFIARDATRPGPAPAACSLAFLDPPYGKALAAPALEAFMDQVWFAPGGLIVVEIGAGESFEPPAGLSIIETRKYGAAAFVILRFAVCNPCSSGVSSHERF